MESKSSTSIPVINPERVGAIFLECLYDESKDLETQVVVNGVINTASFNLDRLKKHENEIYSILNELPDTFKASGGGGWSFLNACTDKHGNIWTDFHMRVEQLVLLGIAIGKVQFILPRDLWSSLPGSMPYLAIT